MHLLRKALPTFNANPDGGVLLITSSIAGIRPRGSAMAYSVSKAAGQILSLKFHKRANVTRKGLHLVKCLAVSQGPKIRVNAIVPGLLLTEWVGSAD